MKRPHATRPPAGQDLPLIPRVFAVSAAVLLVGSVALASLLPGDISLSQALREADAEAPFQLQAAIVGTLGHGIWSALFAPFLARPVWMIPVCLGILCVGGAVSALTHISARTKQRRS